LSHDLYAMLCAPWAMLQSRANFFMDDTGDPYLKSELVEC
jgi:hypothetical protein